MSLSEVSTIASIVSSFAVAASLVYLALQTHQNAKHTKALIWQGVAELGVNVAFTTADECLSRALVIDNGREPTPEAIRQMQCSSLYRGIYIMRENLLMQQEMGLVDRSFAEATRATSVEALKRMPALRQHHKSMLAGWDAQRLTPARRRVHAEINSQIEEAERPT